VLLCDADQTAWVRQGGRGRNSKLIGWKEISEIVNQRQADGPAILVTKDEIKANEYDLTVSRYVLGRASRAMKALAQQEKTARLEDVAELIRAQALKEDKTPQGDEYLEVGPKDIGEDGYIIEPEKCLKLSGRVRDRAELQRLHPGDVLLVAKGSVGKVALVGDNCGDNWVASQAYQVIRLGPNSPVQSPEFLYRYLASPLVKAYLGEQTTGTTIPMLSTKEIKGLLVPVPSIEKQKQVSQTHKEILAAHERIRAIQQEIKALDQQYWPLDSKQDASDNA
jgi:type I restriction enzyme M protein